MDHETKMYAASAPFLAAQLEEARDTIRMLHGHIEGLRHVLREAQATAAKAYARGVRDAADHVGAATEGYDLPDALLEDMERRVAELLETPARLPCYPDGSGQPEEEVGR